MQAIEFKAQLDKGTIHLPASHQHWQEGKRVKVIVLADEDMDDPKEQRNGQSINRHAGKINLTLDPLDFQKIIRNEWP